MGHMKLRWGSADGMAIRGVEATHPNQAVLCSCRGPPFTRRRWGGLRRGVCIVWGCIEGWVSCHMTFLLLVREKVW